MIEHDKFNVSYYVIAVNLSNVKHVLISSEIETQEEAIKLLPIAQERYPDAKISRDSWWFSAENDAGRAEALERMAQPTRLIPIPKGMYKFNKDL